LFLFFYFILFTGPTNYGSEVLRKHNAPAFFDDLQPFLWHNPEWKHSLGYGSFMKNKITDKTISRPISLFSVILFLALTVVIIIIGYAYYLSEKNNIQYAQEAHLRIIANLKAEQLIRWREERIDDARAIAAGPLYLINYEKWLNTGKKNDEQKKLLIKRLMVAQTSFKYHSIAILDNNGKINLSTNGINSATGDCVSNHLQETIKSRKIIFGDLYFCPHSHKILVDVLAPLIVHAETKNSNLGVLRLTIDPNEYLYPMLQSWPALSNTSETLLVRMEGDNVVYLNELRHKKGTALSLQIPVSEQKLPVAMAIRGQEGIVNGYDYRGVAVLGFIKHIPDSNWYMIVKTDYSEVFSPLNRIILLLIIMAFLLIALFGALIRSIFILQNRRYYDKLYTSETELKQALDALKESEFKYRNFFDLSNDGMTIYRNDKVINCNVAAAKMYRFSVEKIIGSHFWNFLPEYQPDGTLSIEAGKGPVRLALKGKPNVSEFRFLRGDGTTFDGEVTINSIVLNNERYYQTIVRDITERKKEEEAIKESELKYRTLFEMSHDGMTIYRNDKIIDTNQAMLKMFRINSDHVIGDEAWRFLPEYQPDGKLSVEIAKEALRFVTHNEPLTREYTFLRGDGTTFVGEVTISSAVLNEDRYYQTIIRDITERKQAEETIRLSEEKYRSLLDNSSEAILLADTQGNIIEGNKKAEELFGYSLPELLKLRVRDIHPPTELKLIKNIFDQITTDGYGSVDDTAILKKNGEIIPVDITAGIIENSGVKVIQGIFRDITERKLAVEESQRLVERLQRSEKMESLGMLAGGVAHDLNNVLGIIVGYSELLLHETNIEAPFRKRIENILNSSERATAIVQDLLTLARRGVQTRKVLNLNTIIHDYLSSPEFLKLSSYHIHAKVKTDLESELLNISGSPIHLTKTLMNLISNAAEAMPKGGTITVQTENRYIDSPIKGYDEVQRGDYAVLTITDTGEGILAEDINRIFEPFYTKKIMGRSGTGLGLAVVWGTLKDANGYIDVHSEPDNGTSFILYFPVTREEISAQHKSVALQQLMGSGESILVIDDVTEQRELATQMLSNLNYKVQSAASGEEALTYLKNHQVDIIVLDMIMDPGIDGLETYERILNIHPKQKAIIVSGFSETDRVLRAQALGAGAYVKKPYIQEQIGLAIRKELDKA
jgi:PAS domain S-box-containing protein